MATLVQSAGAGIWNTSKTELDDGQLFETRQVAKSAVFAFIERFYNRRRLHSATAHLADMEQIVAGA